MHHCTVYSKHTHTHTIQSIINTFQSIDTKMASIRKGELVLRQLGSAMTITLNRPKALNALSYEQAVDLRDLHNKWRQEDADFSAIIVSGAGGKAFCAGGDVKSIWNEVDAVGFRPGGLGMGFRGMLSSDFFRDEYEMNYLVGSSKIPQVSLWDGIVMGGGVGLSALGKFRVATEKSLFAMPETAIGLFPDVGSSSWLYTLGNGFGEYIGLTGARLGAGDLMNSGIATHYVKSEKLEQLTKAISELPASNASAYAAREQSVKAVLDDFSHASGAPDYKNALTVSQGDVIGRHFANKLTVEEIVASLQAHEGNDFAASTLAVLRKMCPASLKITLEQIRRGGAMNGVKF
jgi:enoyl-CoA hydratase/carnithine racemase